MAVAAGATLFFALPAAPVHSAPTLPPIDLSTTTFHDGDVGTMSGTDCIDPDTGSGEGLVVVLRRPVDLGRGGTSPRLPTIGAPVAADGTFSGPGTITHPLFPDGMQTAVATCERPNPVEADTEVSRAETSR